MAKKHFLGLMSAFLILAGAGCTLEADVKAGGSAAEQGEAAMTQYRPESIDGINIDKNTAVVTDTVADVFSKPDIRSERLTQVLYNQPVSIMQEKTGWSKVKTADGNEGWLKSKFVEHDISSIYGKSCYGRIVVTSREKPVYTQPKGGITAKDAVMGTVFYTFNSADSAYEVYLPGNTTGWLRGSGIIRLGFEDGIPLTSAGDFAATALKYKGAGYLWNGLSARGIDSSGLLYVCARINGIVMPRQTEMQQKMGIELDIGSPYDIARLKKGDLLFFTTETDSGKTFYSGIFVGDGKYIYSSKSSGSVIIEDIDMKNPEGVLTSARRIFGK